MPHRSYCLIFFIILCSFYAQSQNVKPDKRLAGLDTLVKRVLRDWYAPGVSIAVVEKNKIVYTNGFGFRDMDKKLPVTENTLFAIGSCTKAFTAAMIGMLVEEGKLDIDKPVRDYLPELKFPTEYLNDHVTVRDMMSHRTGLPRHDLSWYGASASRYELMQRIQYLEPTAELRQKYQYNNFMYMSLGVLIEKLTGKSWEENVRTRILIPLEMNTTTVSMEEMEKSENRSLAYSLKNDTIIQHIPYRNIDAIAPAGAINSSAKEMAAWLITWINIGKINGKQIIPSSFRNEAITEQMATATGLPDSLNPDVYFAGYGFAWGQSSYRGHYRVSHNGGIDGFISSTTFFPSDSIGIFVVSDQNEPVTAIRNFISDRMLKLTYRDWNQNLLNAAKKSKEAAKNNQKNEAVSTKPITHPSHPLKDYSGSYSNPGYGNIEIDINKDTLYAKFNAFALRLDHIHYDQFEAKSLVNGHEDGNSFTFRFQLDETGEVEKLLVPLQEGVKDIEFRKLPPAFHIAPADLKPFTGEYNLGNLVAKIFLKGENTLYLFVPGQPEYELVPIDSSRFSIKSLKGFIIQFNRDSNQQVTEFLSIQPNGTFKGTKKN